jgi:hypothetical protein
MARSNILGWCATARAMTIALLAGLFVAACGGGGGGGGGGSTTPALEGTWRVSFTEQGTTSTGGTVPASSVPTQAQVSSFTVASMAQVLSSTTYQNYIVTVNGNVITITGPSTNVSITVNSVSGTNYQGCGSSCGVGATVSYTLNLNLTAIGTLNGNAVGGTDSGSATVRYTRVT